MPKPLKGESREDFIARAIVEFRHEGYPKEEAIGRAYGFWRQYHGKPKHESMQNYYAPHKDKHKSIKARQG